MNFVANLRVGEEPTWFFVAAVLGGKDLSNCTFIAADNCVGDIERNDSYSAAVNTIDDPLSVVADLMGRN